MAKVITSMIERERPDGYKEYIVQATDPVTGETSVERAEWYYDGDRGVRVDMANERVLR